MLPNIYEMMPAKAVASMALWQILSDFYRRLIEPYPAVQPTLTALYADSHVEGWKVRFRQNRAQRALRY